MACRQKTKKLETEKMNRKTENHIGHQIRKTACVVAEKWNSNAKKGKNCNLRQTTKSKDWSFSLQKLKSQPKLKPKTQKKTFLGLLS